MSKLAPWQKGLIVVVTLCSILAISLLQILNVDSTTKTESTLFNILQFLFSLFFAWFLSVYFGEAQFAASQKKFAIGAFRRIKEIERSINRTQIYLSHLEQGADEVTRAKVIAVRGGLDSMKDTVGSSIADWGDIIGDEIQISREVNKLKHLRSAEEEQSTSVSSHQKPTETDTKISQLLESLPPELQRELELEDVDNVGAGIELLQDNWHDDRALYLDSFWEKDGGFTNDLKKLSVGDVVFVAKGIAGNRNGTLMVYNGDHEQVGVIVNCCHEVGCNYDDFVSVVEHFYDSLLIPKCFGGTPLKATIESMDESNTTTSNRQYFTIRIECPPREISN
ncbi:hypothetical protein ACU6D0_000818 [Vibrio alginolyticus]|uniref:hypothetical protein n=1 Tax=Vibrio alginolyticus TaxID=663 RepID=UPI001BD2D320|nr:hypothetical protein [Vibrio alginolyticus]HCG8221502.1 hypothetical protein [Vibrio parahaemolyticus]EGR0167536.1 hypothetical protein [Vibrio alginolyticus]EJS0368905.1 hypothetical protein [Vibrio alginolyticus]MBS9866538.1 hypothetical protein [Vibrio alginolyticus]MBS9889565.1 hypothetical protein [Vibrio alginolyticus]